MKTSVSLLLVDQLELESGGEYSHLKVAAVELKESVKGVYLKTCELNHCDISGLGLPETTLKECSLLTCEAVGTDCNRAYIEDTVLIGSRCSGIKLYESKQKLVTYTDCKLDMANFSNARLRKVRFENCLLQNADLTNVVFDRVEMVGCELERANFSNAQIKNLDLRGSKLAGVIGTTSLKGAIVTYDQLLELAPSLAQDVGLVIEGAG